MTSSPKNISNNTKLNQFFKDVVDAEIKLQQAIDKIAAADKYLPNIAMINMGIKSTISDVSSTLNNIEILIEEQENGEEEEASLLQRVKKHRNKLEQLSLKHRSAKATYRAAEPLLARQQRAELLSHGDHDNSASGGSQESILQRMTALSKSQHITQSLERAKDALATGLKHSNEAVDRLDTSSSTLQKLLHQYSSYSGELKQSSGLMGSLRRQETIDRLIVFAAFLFFCLVVVYIMYKRLPFRYLYRFVKHIFVFLFLRNDD
eukprot:gb/GECH01013703.1/.p1 GENE.gb/GECH01013703.1/~~gb/GECH01013703.1/.p1  ORF type:complete len:263 (+),score=63.70 gb/GECH01013703.1/:1-789(+)